MDFSVKSTEISKHKTQCAIVFTRGKNLLASASTIDQEYSGLLSSAIKAEDLGEKTGSALWLQLPPGKFPCERALLINLGAEQTSGKNKSKTPTGLSTKDLDKVLQVAAKAVMSRPVKECTLFIDDLTLEGDAKEADAAKIVGEKIATAFEYHLYRYTETKASTKTPKLAKVAVIGASAAANKGIKAGMSTGAALAAGLNLTRELGNLPGNICTPSYLADLAKDLAQNTTTLTTKVLGEKQMEKLKMGSLLSVSRGSDEEAKLIIMEYNNAGKTSKPHVLVGKGITFDTGGISLKPGPGMDEMKFDMCGAASVFGTMKALVEMQAKVHVVAIVAASENMPSGRATKPGDVVTSMSGQTIEILNTDAEGRLVLCDALTYAERYKPKSVVDIATLTGACVIALGNHASGLYANDDELAAKLLEAGEVTNDRAWHMPLWDEYQKSLDSNFADMANIGGREAGSITAACFLSRYTKSYKWAHLDIAGTAWHSGARKGATGRPVKLLVHYLLNN
ncbi:Cytosol aminopeptidase [Thalassocella blandensis]|nr:Cytosol aminopeptidase [Thalassocella blandensis]